MAAVAASYLLVFPYFPKLNNPNENVRFYMTAALVQDGAYRIDGPWERWGWVNDSARTDDGHRYSVKAPGTSWLAVPGFALYDALPGELDRKAALWVCRVSASVVPSLLFLWLLYGWLGRRAPDRPELVDAALLSLALGSNYYGYSLLFVSHSLAAASGFGAFMLIHDRRHPALAGLLTASATMFEYPAVVVSAILAGWALASYPRKAWPGFVAAALLPAAAVMHFHWSAFGSPFTPGHRWLENPAYRKLARQGLYGASSWPKPEALLGLTLDPGYGLLPMTPLLAAALLPPFRQRGGLIALGAPAALLLTISCMNNWRGGWTVGPRYLTPILPFLVWRAVEGLRRLPRRPARWFALAALAVALLLSGLTSAWYPHVPPKIAFPLTGQLLPMLKAGGLPWLPASLLVAAWFVALDPRGSPT